MPDFEDPVNAGSSAHPERVAPEREPTEEQLEERPWGEGEDKPDHEGNEVVEQQDAPGANAAEHASS